MKLKYEKSKNIKYIKMNKKNFYGAMKNGIIYTAIGLSLLNLSSSNSQIKKDKSNGNNFNKSNVEYVENEYNKNFYNHLFDLDEIANEEYDELFIRYYNSGKLSIKNINNEVIDIDLFKVRLITIEKNGNDITYLIDTSKDNNNIFDGSTCDLTKIKKFSDFKYSNIFYELYLNNQDSVEENNSIELDYNQSIELFKNITNWDGNYNNELPETRLINNERSR